MGRKTVFSLATLLLLFLASCSTSTISVANQIYTYSESGFGGDFVIVIYDDGTYTYSEGPLSSLLGTGNWSLNGSTLCLTDDSATGTSAINYFEVRENSLIFMSRY